MRSTDSYASGFAPSHDLFDPTTDDFVTKDRKYIHFDNRLSDEARASFSFSEAALAKHPFWPLLGFTKSERRIKTNEKGEKYFKAKNRDIKFGSHRDAAILEIYSKRLSALYEQHISNKSFGSAILAYRSGVGDNVTQAKALFSEIRERENTVALAMDITGFFDNINHAALLANIKRVLNSDRLDKSDFHVFKTMTSFSWVETDALRERLGKKYGRHNRICTAEDFRGVVRAKDNSLISVNKNDFGIPQGTPLSGLYANIAMLEFDRIIFNYVSKRGGSYRRYSDDLAFLLPIDFDQELLLRHVKRSLKIIGLEVNESKTEISKFQMCKKEIKSDRAFQYLGFTFDGQTTLIRNSSLNRYYKKMNRGIRAKVRAAYENEIPRNDIFMRELYKRYTHYGKVRNFPRYAYRAARILGSPSIRNQVKGHLRKFRESVVKNVNEVYGLADS